MFLKKSTNKKTGRTYLSIVNTYHDSKKKQTRTSTIRSLGYLDVLEKEYDDPTAHFTEEVRKMNEKANNDKRTITLRISPDETLDIDGDSRKNFGYAVLSKIYHELGINKFLSTTMSRTTILKLTNRMICADQNRSGSKVNTYILS